MAQPVSVIYVVVICLILLGVLLLLLWGQITSVKLVRTAALAITGFISLYFPVIGGALSDLVKTVVWF